MSTKTTTSYFPILYKRTATGAIQQWVISVKGTTIVTTFGQVDGAMQTTKDLVKSGKNQGRKNETGAEEQAMKEAQSRWEKKKKSGYVGSIPEAERGEVDKIIEGGIDPMLAKVFAEHRDKLKYPVMVQPKLDGARMICVVKDGNVSLWTRTRKRITSMAHIEKQIKELVDKLGISDITLDGEAYNHNMKDNFSLSLVCLKVFLL